MKKGFRMITTVMTTVLVSAMLFTGCSTKSAENSKVSTNTPTENASGETASKGLSGNLELQVFVGGYGDAWWNEMIDGFQKENPDLKIKKNMGAQINATMKTRWLGEDTPDLVFLDGPDLAWDAMEADGQFLDLRSFYSSAAISEGKLVKDSIMKGLVDENKEVYRAPYILSTWGTWYDDKYFTDNNLKVPSNFDELMALGEQLKKQKVSLMDFAGQYQYLLRGTLYQQLISEGGTLLQDAVSLKPGVFTSPAFKKALTKYEKLAKAGYFLNGTVALNHTQSQMEWLNHNAALIPNGLWLESEMKKDIPSGFNMKFIPSVMQDAGQPYAVGVNSINIAISSKAKNKEAALAFLGYLYREENVKRFVEMTGSPAALNIDISNLNVADSTKSVQNWLADSNVAVVPQPRNIPQQVEDVLRNGVNAIILGEATVDSVAESAEQEAVKVR
ncbi:hypothetical protein SY83_02085 [Paenibacillus swuensis]|uniref:ABC transporter substrate-binding protein n=1 Tax=Paenibacillus swuensis TaxID=1178515 RepID=A0A172TE52_9BACL|nr:extracellular solute-binding protein [Paenibacillus swuensis]ANE45318.1 hypothetical protein SY83_02085 [Paenibacillus swuensis]